FVRPEIAPLPQRQAAQRNAADAHALEPEYAQAHRFAHAADLALASFAQHEAKLVRVDPRDLGRTQGNTIERQSVPKPREIGRGERAGGPDEVFLLDARVGADQLPRDATVLREHEQAGGVDVEPSR